MKIEVKKDIPGHKAGDVVHVTTDPDGNPHQKFWRDRLKDAELDGSVVTSIVEPPKPKAPVKQTSTEEDS